MEAICERRTDDVNLILDKHPESIGFQYPLDIKHDRYDADASGLSSRYTCDHMNEITIE